MARDCAGQFFFAAAYPDQIAAIHPTPFGQFDS